MNSGKVWNSCHTAAGLLFCYPAFSMGVFYIQHIVLDLKGKHCSAGLYAVEFHIAVYQLIKAPTLMLHFILKQSQA